MRKINMMKTTIWARTSVLFATLAVMACASNGNSGSGTQPSQQSQQTAGYSQQGMSAPVVLNLRGPAQPPNGGQITLDLEIVVNEPVQAPVSLRILLPQGSQLVSGLPSETLTLSQAGRLYRQFVLQTQGPLSQPVVVEADAQNPNNAWGFTARRQYPANTEVAPSQPRSPAMGRPPAMRP